MNNTSQQLRKYRTLDGHDIKDVEYCPTHEIYTFASEDGSCYAMPKNVFEALVTEVTDEKHEQPVLQKGPGCPVVGSIIRFGGETVKVVEGDIPNNLHGNKFCVKTENGDIEVWCWREMAACGGWVSLGMTGAKPETEAPADAWLDRLIGETRETAERLNGLNAFMGSDKFPTLPREDKDLLYEQQRAMSTYVQILGKRIERANGQFTHNR